MPGRVSPAERGDCEFEMSGLTTYHWIVVAVIFVGAVGLYFVPTVIVVSNRHPRRIPIIVLNVVGGATGVGWIVALIWR